MRGLRRVLIRPAGYFGAARRERGWNADFEAHLQLHIEDNLRAGMSVEEARSEALLKFGGMEPIKESMRDSPISHGSMQHDATSDMLCAGCGAVRVLRLRQFCLTLGLGASLAVFNVADNLLRAAAAVSGFVAAGVVGGRCDAAGGGVRKCGCCWPATVAAFARLPMCARPFSIRGTDTRSSRSESDNELEKHQN